MFALNIFFLLNSVNVALLLSTISYSYAKSEIETQLVFTVLFHAQEGTICKQGQVFTDFKIFVYFFSNTNGADQSGNCCGYIETLSQETFQYGKFKQGIQPNCQILRNRNYQVFRSSDSLQLGCHSLDHGQCYEWLCRPYLCCLWIDLDVLYGFATQNLIRRPFMMVREVKKLLWSCLKFTNSHWKSIFMNFMPCLWNHVLIFIYIVSFMSFDLYILPISISFLAKLLTSFDF